MAMKFKFSAFILILFFISSESHAAGGGTGSGLIDNIYVNNGWTMAMCQALLTILELLVSGFTSSY